MKFPTSWIFALGFAVAALGQQSAPQLAKPADSGPTLAQTMQFIQQKLSEQGQVGWAETLSSNGVIQHRLAQVSDIMADPATCTLYTTETVDSTMDLPKGRVLKPGATLDDLHTHTLETDTISFKQVEKITVEKLEDLGNQAFAEAAHPEIKVTLTPTVFYVKLWATDAVFSAHTSTTKGKQAPVEKDVTSKTGGITIRDEVTANRVAKAMTHAMELCGGGVAKKELF
ncbi:MAG: hypothetical protein ABSE46_20200 [Terracidiphilus sp.]|jgi:hypothetical protein